MNRRGFLGAMLGAVAGATLDPERLLWVPGRKVYSVPKLRDVNFEMIAELYVKPAMLNLAEEIDLQVLAYARRHERGSLWEPFIVDFQKLHA